MEWRFWFGLIFGIRDERRAAFEETRELGFEEPSEVSFEDTGLLFTVGHRALAGFRCRNAIMYAL
jgi:hypothetical protein